jgi:hypothetical protein
MTTPTPCAVTVFADSDGLYPLGTPLIRVARAGEPDAVASAIAAHIGRTGSVFLELPDGTLTIVVTVDSETWNPHPD